MLPTPTERELEILKILWDEGEATVRAVYEEMRRHAPIAQNTVQAFLRTMEEKGLVQHRTEGRTFIYQPLVQRGQTQNRLVSRLLQRVFDGAVDQLVASAFSSRPPTAEEMANLERILTDFKSRRKPSKESKP